MGTQVFDDSGGGTTIIRRKNKWTRIVPRKPEEISADSNFPALVKMIKWYEHQLTRKAYLRDHKAMLARNT